MQAFLPVVFTAGNDIKKQDKGSEDRNADPLNFRRSFQRVYCFNIVYSISECVFARDRCFPVTPRSGCDRNTCNGISANICTGDPAQLPCLCRISCVSGYVHETIYAGRVSSSSYINPVWTCTLSSQEDYESAVVCDKERPARSRTCHGCLFRLHRQCPSGPGHAPPQSLSDRRDFRLFSMSHAPCGLGHCPHGCRAFFNVPKCHSDHCLCPAPVHRGKDDRGDSPGRRGRSGTRAGLQR